ncbi:hypothetical protein EDM56_07260 [Brevibacillus fluminis]|uniref:Uncharacterized protein n=1 Tax=Brevibacillus fluminis TaxID=511487 RepID=A0A3M8DQ91_9BACL|nr:hypothetical protein EDM56_07260 [Brevibacillus fluminis]
MTMPAGGRGERLERKNENCAPNATRYAAGASQDVDVAQKSFHFFAQAWLALSKLSLHFLAKIPSLLVQ